MIRQSKLKTAVTMLSVSVALALGANAYAAAHAEHEHAAGTTPALKLNAGKKWQTDAPLREGMGKIRSVIETNLDAVHGGKLAAAQYKAVAADINGQIAYIVQNCKLDKDADEVLHQIIGQIAQGVDAMEGKDKKLKPRAGFVKVTRALDSYGKYFDDAGWKALKAVQ